MLERRIERHPSLRRPSRARLAAVAVSIAILAGLLLPFSSGAEPPAVGLLPPVSALGERVDTFALGGFSQGGFEEALHALATEMDEGERGMIGRYLDRIFAHALDGEGLGERGRLRIVYERRSSPNGTPRSIHVLGAEAAVRGSVHTAIVHEHDDGIGYFDDWGTSLDRSPWLDPLERARISSPFGQSRRHPILGRRLPHLGVDLAAPEGASVRAAADGRITHAGRRGGYGILVEIQHPNGFSTRYAHLLSIDPGIAPGAPVRQGEPIGRVGQSGLATGPHLHFEVRMRGEAVDPVAALQGQGVAGDVAHDPEWRLQRERVREMITAVSTVQRSDDRAPRPLHSER